MPLSVAHELFHVIYVVGDALCAYEAASAGGYQHVVFDAYSAEVAVFVYLVEIQEFRVCAFAPPVVDEVGNEIDAGLVGYHEAGLEPASEAQGVGAKLCGRAHFVVVTHISLPEAFHVVHVHAHRVPQAVGQEQRMRSGAQRFLHVAPH